MDLVVIEESEYFNMAKKFNKEYLQNKINEKRNDILILDEVKGYHDKIKMFCKIHDMEYFQTPWRALDGNCGCPKCISEINRKNHLMQPEIFYQKLKDINYNIEPLSEFKGMKNKILCRCKICGYEWEAIPDNLISKKSGCPCCSNSVIVIGYNDIASKYPEYIDLFVDKNYAYTNSVTSHKKTEIMCPVCGHIKIDSIANVHYQGFSCPICSDGISYPNKVMGNILKELNQDFQSEYSPDWLNGKRFDFYIESLDLIIEMDGSLGHGKKVFNNSILSVEETKELDKWKDLQANKYGLTVIRINCDKSNIDFIKDNILQSELLKYFNFTEIDWNHIDIKSRGTILSDIAKYIKEGVFIEDISNSLHICTETVKKYARIAEEYGLCPHYKTIASERKNKSLSKRKATKNNIFRVVCLDNRKIFSTYKEACEWCGLKDSKSIRLCCKGERLHAGNDKETLKELHWAFYDDYINMTEEDIQYIINRTPSYFKKVIRLNDNMIFDKIIDVTTLYNLKNEQTITNCCKRKNNFISINGEKIYFMFYDDYLLQQECTR